MSGQLDRAIQEAEKALLEARPASEAEIETRLASGAIGKMPGVSSMDLARLQENLIRARNAARRSS
jgi:hypothetical protein